MKSIGTRGNAPEQFNTPHTIATDAKGNIYVGDRGNQRIQVFDPDLNPIRIISNVRAPWAMCITPPNPQGQQFLYSSDAGGKIYKEDLEGHLLGWFGTHRQEGRAVLLGARDALRQRERALHRRGAELARAAHHDEAGAAVVRGGQVGASASDDAGRTAAVGALVGAGRLQHGDGRCRAPDLRAELLPQLHLYEAGSRDHRHRGLVRHQSGRAVHQRRVLERRQPRRRGAPHRAGAVERGERRVGAVAPVERPRPPRHPGDLAEDAAHGEGRRRRSGGAVGDARSARRRAKLGRLARRRVPRHPRRDDEL